MCLMGCLHKCSIMISLGLRLLLTCLYYGLSAQALYQNTIGFRFASLDSGPALVVYVFYSLFRVIALHYAWLYVTTSSMSIDFFGHIMYYVICSTNRSPGQYPWPEPQPPVPAQSSTLLVMENCCGSRWAAPTRQPTEAPVPRLPVLLPGSGA